MRVSYDAGLCTLTVAGREPLGRYVKRAGRGRRTAVAGHASGTRAGRGRSGGRGLGHRCRTSHAAVTDRRRGALGGGRRALFIEAAVHHGPPRHPGGSPRSGGWGGSGGMHMFVQGGRGARHGVGDVEDDGRMMGSQHRKVQ